MLTPEYLKQQPEHVVGIFLDLEDEIIGDISRRIKENMELTETSEYQIEMLYRMGYDIDDIEKKIAEAMDISERELQKVLEDAAETSYENDRRIYKKGGKELPALDKNPKMVDFIDVSIRQTQGELRNLTNTMGFVSNKQFMRVPSFYRNTLDNAVWQLSTGAFDYNTVLRQAVKTIGDSGLRIVEYESGHKLHIESAVRLTAMTGMSQITGYMSEANADMMGQDLMEITAHMGARPSHQEWQGQIVSREGRRGYLSLEDIGYGDGDGFKGWNCRHDWFPFFEGVSEPAYTKKDLGNIDPPPFEYGGRVYDAYEASQKQRYYERQMRKTKRNIIAYEGAELEDELTAAAIKLKRQREEYEKFSKAAGLRAKHERHHTYNYGRSMSMKAAWARR